MANAQSNFKLQARELRDLAIGRGSCIATDLITIDGEKVCFMYRTAPDDDDDSGWRFLSGLETEEYMHDPTKHAIYDVNTIANYDPDIIPLLDAPAGSAFERDTPFAPFEKVANFEAPED